MQMQMQMQIFLDPAVLTLHLGTAFTIYRTNVFVKHSLIMAVEFDVVPFGFSRT